MGFQIQICTILRVIYKKCSEIGNKFLNSNGSVACENIRFSSLFVAWDVSRGTSPAAKSEEKRMFSQATMAAFAGCV